MTELTPVASLCPLKSPVGDFRDSIPDMLRMSGDEAKRVGRIESAEARLLLFLEDSRAKGDSSGCGTVPLQVKQEE